MCIRVLVDGCSKCSCGCGSGCIQLFLYWEFSTLIIFVIVMVSNSFIVIVVAFFLHQTFYLAVVVAKGVYIRTYILYVTKCMYECLITALVKTKWTNITWNANLYRKKSKKPYLLCYEGYESYERYLKISLLLYIFHIASCYINSIDGGTNKAEHVQLIWNHN